MRCYVPRRALLWPTEIRAQQCLRFHLPRQEAVQGDEALLPDGPDLLLEPLQLGQRVTELLGSRRVVAVKDVRLAL